MAEFKGQTDKVTQIKITSVLLSAKWGLPTVALGGSVPIEIQTLYVANGSKVNITIKDAEAKTVDSLAGEIHSNYYKMPYTVKADASKSLFFEAELPDHKLKGHSGRVQVALAKITDLKWFDDQGKEVTETTEDKVLLLKAKCPAIADETPAFISVLLKLSEEGEKTVFEGQTQVQDGKVELAWKSGLKYAPEKIKDHTTLDKVGEDYYHPELVFKVSCLGVTASSAPITVTHNLVLIYASTPGHAGDFEGKKIGVIAPDGSREDHPIPTDGRIEVKQTKPGLYRIDESEIKELLA